MLMSKVEVLRAACCVAGIDDAMVERAKEDCQFFEEQFEVLKADPAEAMVTLCGVAIADGDLSTDERVLLQHFATRLGLPPEKCDKLLQRAEQYLASKKK